MAKPKLGYWKTRGIGQPIRLLLTYLGVDFEDVKHELGDGPEFSKDEWLSVKETLGIAFPNLPYYIDGDVKISQSNAILKHIGRKYNLDGATEVEKADVDMLLDVVMDLRNAVIQLTYYSSDYEKSKETHYSNLQPAFKLFEKKLGDNPWFAGKSITVPDFHFYEMMYQHECMKPGCLADYPKLTAFVQRFEALPKIKEYLAKPEVQNLPVNNKIASFIK